MHLAWVSLRLSCLEVIQFLRSGSLCSLLRLGEFSAIMSMASFSPVIFPLQFSLALTFWSSSCIFTLKQLSHAKHPGKKNLHHTPWGLGLEWILYEYCVLKWNLHCSKSHKQMAFQRSRVSGLEGLKEVPHLLKAIVRLSLFCIRITLGPPREMVWSISESF